MPVSFDTHSMTADTLEKEHDHERDNDLIRENQNFAVGYVLGVAESPDESAIDREMVNVFSQQPAYLRELDEKGVFHRIHAYMQRAQGPPVALPDPQRCTDPATACRFALVISRAFRLRHDEWLANRRRFGETPPFPAQERELYRAYMLLLRAAGIMRVSTCPDWEVGRGDDELTRRLGLRGSMLDVEVAWAERHSLPGEKVLCGIKGPGDGTTVGEWDAESKRCIHRGAEQTRRCDTVHHVSFGDRLYCNLREILQHFLRPEAEKNPRAQRVVEVITYALQRKLHDKWSSAPQPCFLDLNREVFSLLNDPNGLFADLVQRGLMRQSGEYTDDGIALMDLETRRWLAGYRGGGMANPDDAGQLQEFRDQHLRMLDELCVQVDTFLTELAFDVSCPVEPLRLREMAAQYGAWTGQNPSDTVGVTVLTDWLSRLRDVVLKDIAWLESLRSGAPPRRRASGDAGMDHKQALRHYFNDGFVDAVANAARYREDNYYHDLDIDDIDLNAMDDVCPRNFIPTYFVDIPARFDKRAYGSFTLITSVRAGSHQSESDVLRDLEQNLALLREGGALMVDDFRQSYTRIVRFIRTLPAGYRMWFAMSPDGEPMSLVIQRVERPETQCLAEDTGLRSRVFADGVVLADPNQVMGTRLDLSILDETRRKLMEGLGSAEYFFGLQQAIIDNVRRRLLWAMSRHLAKQVKEDMERDDMAKTVVDAAREWLRVEIESVVSEELLRLPEHEREAARDRVRKNVERHLGKASAEEPQPEKKKTRRKKAGKKSGIGDPKKFLAQSPKEFRTWGVQHFGATENSTKQKQWQVLQRYDDAMLHGLITALGEHVIASPSTVEAVVWDMARNVERNAVHVLGNTEKLEADIVANTIEKVLKFYHAQYAKA